LGIVVQQRPPDYKSLLRNTKHLVRQVAIDIGIGPGDDIDELSPSFLASFTRDAWSRILGESEFLEEVGQIPSLLEKLSQMGREIRIYGVLKLEYEQLAPDGPLVAAGLMGADDWEWQVERASINVDQLGSWLDQDWDWV
tara:strand:- start:393 stop:812 length:420 start_codon:yes stop_codon:yes gene_type:complete